MTAYYKLSHLFKTYKRLQKTFWTDIIWFSTISRLRHQCFQKHFSPYSRKIKSKYAVAKTVLVIEGNKAKLKLDEPAKLGTLNRLTSIAEHTTTMMQMACKVTTAGIPKMPKLMIPFGVILRTQTKDGNSVTPSKIRKPFWNTNTPSTTKKRFTNVHHTVSSTSWHTLVAASTWFISLAISFWLRIHNITF